MAVYEIVKIGDPVLREKAKTVTKFNSNLGRLMDDMYDTMVAAKGVGLAAPQIGISKRVVVIDVGEGRIELVNPEILEAEGSQIDMEGCLSIPDFQEEVNRSQRVKVKAQNRNGEEYVIEGTGFLARALQHEIDHLEGVLFVDLLDKSLPSRER
ncbi:peptide deformylase [Heliobacterium chlorum]|uniref:Peptide deformylase n=1 Tax=Heliobacterium chlorum TaxID=2698 RepID=A0ABR7T063_HELCL|nr:peptide deformylase [Heliobacterium chlorum]MBC9783325.1 peptide deformylase [Heliobacterium chlorum]